jgi:hypothetical protein
MMSKLPPSPFLSAEAVAPSVEPAAVLPSLSSGETAAGSNSELMCVEPSLIRVLDAGRSGRTDCSPIDSIGRDPKDGVVKAWSPGPRAVTGDNSKASIDISVIRHNPITQAVEIRPVSNSGRVEGDCSGIKRGVNPTQGGESSIRDRTSGLPDATAGETATNHIAEIFIGAGKIDDRRAEDFVDWPALERRIASR